MSESVSDLGADRAVGDPWARACVIQVEQKVACIEGFAPFFFKLRCSLMLLKPDMRMMHDHAPKTARSILGAQVEVPKFAPMGASSSSPIGLRGLTQFARPDGLLPQP